MDERLKVICERLNPTKLEEEDIRIGPKAFREVVERGNNCLLLKLLLVRRFNREAFKQRLRKIWRLVKPIKFHEPGSSLFPAEFEDVNDKTHVLRNWSWYFDKSLILIKEFDGVQQIRHVCITESTL